MLAYKAPVCQKTSEAPKVELKKKHSEVIGYACRLLWIGNVKKGLFGMVPYVW